MAYDPMKADDELRRRVENYLNQLGCGLRATPTAFEVYNLKDGTIVMTVADLGYFAQTNNLSLGDDEPD